MARASTALGDEWVLWESVTDANAEVPGASYDAASVLRPVAAFATAEDMWRVWHSFPLPSMLFTDGETRGKLARAGAAGETFVTVLALFRRGLRPDWTHAPSLDGGQIRFRGKLSSKFLDSVWKSSILAACGEMLEPAVEDGDDPVDGRPSAGEADGQVPLVAGVRVVDRCGPGVRRFAVELWLTSGPEGDQVLEKDMRAALKRAPASPLGRVGSVAARWKVAMADGLTASGVTTRAGKPAFVSDLMYRPHAQSRAREAVLSGAGPALEASRLVSQEAGTA